MNLAEIAKQYPKNGATLEDFLRPISPPLDINRLTLEMWQHHGSGEGLPLPVTGDASLVINYKSKPGAVLSFTSDDTDLIVVQIQGAHSKRGFRVLSGIRAVDLYVQEIQKIATHPSNSVRRIIMPNEIEGLTGAGSNLAGARYRSFAFRMGMVYSHQEQRFIKELPAWCT